MTDEQIRLLLSLGRDEARLLLEKSEYSMYRRIQSQMIKLVRDYEVQLPLNCLQFVYCDNSVASFRYRLMSRSRSRPSLGLDNLRSIGLDQKDSVRSIPVGTTGMGQNSAVH